MESTGGYTQTHVFVSRRLPVCVLVLRVLDLGVGVTGRDGAGRVCIHTPGHIHGIRQIAQARGRQYMVIRGGIRQASAWRLYSTYGHGLSSRD